MHHHELLLHPLVSLELVHGTHVSATVPDALKTSSHATAITYGLRRGVAPPFVDHWALHVLSRSRHVVALAHLLHHIHGVRSHRLVHPSATADGLLVEALRLHGLKKGLGLIAVGDHAVAFVGLTTIHETIARVAAAAILLKHAHEALRALMFEFLLLLLELLEVKTGLNHFHLGIVSHHPGGHVGLEVELVLLAGRDAVASHGTLVVFGLDVLHGGLALVGLLVHAVEVVVASHGHHETLTLLRVLVHSVIHAVESLSHEALVHHGWVHAAAAHHGHGQHRVHGHLLTHEHGVVGINHHTSVGNGRLLDEGGGGLLLDDGAHLLAQTLVLALEAVVHEHRVARDVSFDLAEAPSAEERRGRSQLIS